jgi:hypothetical protein
MEDFMVMLLRRPEGIEKNLSDLICYGKGGGPKRENNSFGAPALDPVPFVKRKIQTNEKFKGKKQEVRRHDNRRWTSKNENERQRTRRRCALSVIVRMANVLERIGRRSETIFVSCRKKSISS